ncbi:UPF0262 family protein [Thalassobaculum sp.]|jgi:uncharacterized protein (UPF0262 family)|uniref:UPF0262 family protein n=1 Tax=Thalassobaculum sp. TaxID=2022740 RepID=UPI0032EB22AB
MPDHDPDDAPGAAANSALDLTGEDARIVHITLDERTVIRRSPEVEQERAIAVYDLLEENRFRPSQAGAGPYHLHLRIEENRLILDVRDTGEELRATVALPLTPFRRLVRDYFQICESYYDAIKRLSPSQIEAIDMGRRGLHNEGSTLLQERLDGRVAMDFPTARRLFTLLCVLHIRG